MNTHDFGGVGSCQEEELSWNIKLVYPGSEARNQERACHRASEECFKKEKVVRSVRCCLTRTETRQIDK